MPTFRASQYRWTARWFAEELGAARKKDKVYKALETFTDLHGEDLDAQFTPRYIPVVKVVDMTDFIGWTPPNLDEVHISSTFIRELEATLPSNVPNRGNFAPSELHEKIMLILEATVLHELVHYWRMKRNDEARVNAMSNKGRAIEERKAQDFEIKAYGFRPVPGTLGISQYLPETARIAG